MVKDKAGEKGIIGYSCQGEEFVFLKQIYHFMLILARKIKTKHTHTHTHTHTNPPLEEYIKKLVKRNNRGKGEIKPGLERLY